MQWMGEEALQCEEETPASSRPGRSGGDRSGRTVKYSDWDQLCSPTLYSYGITDTSTIL